MKVVEHKKLSNFHVGSFSSCYAKSKVILEILFCPQFKNLNFIDLSRISKLFGQIGYFPLGISYGHQKMICSLQNFVQLLFWWKFDFSSSFGRISQEDKLWMRTATVIGRGGCSAAGAEPPPRTPPRSWPRSCLLLCFAWTSSSANRLLSWG